MKKRKAGKTFSRKKAVRKALVLSVVRALVQQERIRTTEAKAKAIRPLMERLITKSKLDNLQVRRELHRYFSRDLVHKMVSDIGPRFRDRKGGYTRIIKTAPRETDGAKMAIVELLK